MIGRTLVYAYAEMLGGRWLPGACGGCGRRTCVQYEVFHVEFWDRIVIHPYRCKRCYRRSCRRGTAEERDHHRWLRALRSDRTLRLWLGRRR